MAWVRIDDNIIDHPKFLALTPLAFWLWVEGLTYCQKHLTDGRIPRPVLKGMRHYSPAALKLLTAAQVPGKGPLWHIQQDGTILVHDYLDHNDSAQLILEKRAAAKERMGRSRSLARSREQISEQSRSASANTPRGVVTTQLPSSAEREGGAGETSPQTRVGAFMDWYSDTHERLFGVAYFGTNSDYVSALRLVDKFTDAQLRDGALVWFGQDDDFATRGTRSIPKFASRASDCVIQAQRVAS